MENNTGTTQTGNINDRLQELRASHAAAYARSVRATNVWIGMRMVTALVTVILLAAGIFAPAVLGNTVLGILVALGISYMLRRGIRVLAWLGVLGGVASLVLLLTSLGSYVSMAQQHPLLWVYMAAAVADTLVQCAANGLLLADKEYRAFAQAINRVSHS